MRPLKQILPTLKRGLSRERLRQFAHSPRTRKWGIGIAVFVVLFGLLGFFAAPPLIRHEAEKQLSLLLARPVTVGKVSLDPYTLTLQAERIHVGERGGQGDFVDIGRFLVRVSWSSLWRFKPVIGEIYMDAPQVHVVRSGPQAFNFTDLVEQFSKPAAQPQKPSKPTLFYVANIHVDNGLIDFDDQLTGQKHKLDQLMFGIPFIANLPSKADVFVQPFLHTRIDGSLLALEGQIKPFASTFTAVIDLKLNQLDLPWLMSYAPRKLPLQLPKGQLSTDLHVQFTANAAQPLVQVSGSADLAGLSVTDAAGQPLLQLDALHLAADAVEPLRNVVHLAQLRLDHPVLSLTRDAQGVINLSKLAAAPAAAPAAAEEAPKKTAADKPLPLDFSLRQLALNDGVIHFRDLQNGAHPGLEKLTIQGSGISTLGHAPGNVSVHTSLDQGGELSVNASLNLAGGKAQADIGAEQLQLPPLQPYLNPLLAAQLSHGSAGAKLALKADWSGPAFALQLDDSSLSLDGVQLDTARGTTVLALAHATAAIRKFDLGAHDAALSAIELNGLVVNGERAADGSINLAKLVKSAPPAAAARQPAPAATATAAPQWSYAVDRVLLDKSSVNFTDRGQNGAQPMSFGMVPLRLELQHIGSDLTKPWDVNLSTGFKRNGTLTVRGTLAPAPLKLDLQVDGEQVDIAALDPYVTAKLNATIASALLNLKGEVKLAQDGKQLKVYYKGDAGLARVRMLDKATSDLFTGWKSLDLTQIKAAYDERGPRVNLGTVTLSNFYTRVLLNSNGQLNLSNFVVKDNAPTTSLTRASDAGTAAAPAAAPTPAPAPAPPADASAPPLQLAFGRILLHSGQADYSDNFIKPNFNAHLVSIEGDIGAFGTQSTEPARVAVQATLDNNGPVSINGTVNPLVKPPSLDMTATTRDVELTNFSAYSIKYAGYPIVKGKLNVDLHYQLEQNKLNADNHIFIDQFTFGDHVDSATATNLPVRLAVSLLKNSRGEIDIDVPVSGSLDDPQFSIGGLIWHAFFNLIEKAVSSPFSLLAGAFGGSEELGYVAFDAGSASLSDAEQQKLQTLAKALADKPAVKLDLAGRVDPAVDIPALKQAALQRMVKQQKLRDISGKGDSVDVDSVAVADAEYNKYLEKAYSAADIKKPRNFIGIAKSLPPQEMQQRLLDSVTVGETQLGELAQRRAGAVQQWFAGKVDAGRIYTVAPKLDASGLDGKGPTTRVEFSLK